MMKTSFDGYARPRFIHQPLDHSEQSIRLLKVLPSFSTDGLIRCEIFNATVKVEYECLSYRWGDKDDIRPILLNGKRFDVQRNLHDYLGLRKSKVSDRTTRTPDTIWIDALCIDQTSILERNHQVAQMGAIFRGATVVNIWLGLCPRLHEVLVANDARDLTVIGAVQRNGSKSAILSHIYNIYSFETPYLTSKIVRSAAARFRLKGIEGDFRAGDIRVVLEDEFFGNAYWTLAWITQEIYVARQAVVILPSEEFDIKTCLRVIQRCNDAELCDNKAVKDFARFFGCSGQRSPIRLGGLSDDLLGLVGHFSDRKCLIPRDRIYSLLSLCSKDYQDIVDYARPDDELVYLITQQVQKANLRTSLGLCYASNVAHALMPTSTPLGHAYVDFDMDGLEFEWGSMQPLTLLANTSLYWYTWPETAMFQRMISVTERNIQPCGLWANILDALGGKAILVHGKGLNNRHIKDLEKATSGFKIMSPVEPASIPEGNSFKDLFDSHGYSLMYGFGFSFKLPVLDEVPAFTLRVALSTIWPVLQSSERMSICKRSHSLDNIKKCKHAKFGCGHWNIAEEQEYPGRFIQPPPHKRYEGRADRIIGYDKH